MEIWLSMNDDKLRLPVLPQVVEVEVEQNNQTININELGDITLIGKSGLQSMNLDTFFPNQQYSFVEYARLPKPYDAVRKLDKWRKSGKPVRLIVTTTGINLLMAIGKLSYREQDGTGDVHYSINLQEYKQPKTKQVAKVKVPAPKRPVKPKKKAAKTYVVKRGDTLWAISKRYYGNGNQWRKIYNRNKGVIGSNPNLIYPGQKYVIP